MKKVFGEAVNEFLTIASDSMVSWGFIEGVAITALVFNMLFDNVLMSLWAAITGHAIFILRAAWVNGMLILLEGMAKYGTED